MSRDHLSLLLCAVLLTGCSGSKPPNSVAVTPTTATKSEYPYAECPAIMEWFEKNLDDPKSLEVVEWVSRTQSPVSGVVEVRVTIRANNRFGAKTLFRKAAIVRGENVSQVVDLN